MPRNTRTAIALVCLLVSATAAWAWQGQFLDLTSPTLSQPSGLTYGYWLKSVGGISTLWATDATGNGAVLGSGGGVSDHGALSGLADDDHAQYHNDARHTTEHDATYNNALAISGDVDGNATVGEHVADAAVHWLRPTQTLTVAKDGTGQYNTIAAAAAAANAAASESAPYVIMVYPGVYEEDGISLNPYVSVGAPAPWRTVVKALDSDPTFELHGFNTISGLMVYNQHDGSCFAVNTDSAASIIVLDGIFAETLQAADNAATYVIKDTGAHTGWLMARGCSFWAIGAGGLVYRDNSEWFWTFDNCFFVWWVTDVDAEAGLNLAEANACFFTGCSFTSDLDATPTAGHLSVVKATAASSGYYSRFSSCLFSTDSEAAVTAYQIESEGAGKTYLLGCQCLWADTDGTQYDLYAGAGTTIYTASSVWDSENKEGGTGNIVDLTEGDATFNTLTVNTELTGAGITAGAFADYFWPLGTYARDSEAKALKALSVSANNPTTCNYATSDTAGNAYVQRDLEVDRYAYLPTIKSGTGETVMTTSGDDATFADEVTITDWLWAKTYGLFGPGARAGTAALEINGNSANATGLDFRLMATAGTDKMIDGSNSGLSTSSDYWAYFGTDYFIRADGLFRFKYGQGTTSMSSDLFRPYTTPADLAFKVVNDTYDFSYMNTAGTEVLAVTSAGDVVQGGSADTAESWNPRAGGAATLTFGGAAEGDAFRFDGNVYPDRALVSTNGVDVATDWLDASRCVAIGATPALFSANPGMAYDLALDVSVDSAVYRLPCEWRYEAVTGVRFAAYYTGASSAEVKITAYLKEFVPSSHALSPVRHGTSGFLGGLGWTTAAVDFADYVLLTGCDYYVVFSVDGIASLQHVYIQTIGIDYTKGS